MAATICSTGGFITDIIISTFILFSCRLTASSLNTARTTTSVISFITVLLALLYEMQALAVAGLDSCLGINKGIRLLDCLTNSLWDDVWPLNWPIILYLCLDSLLYNVAQFIEVHSRLKLYLVSFNIRFPFIGVWRIGHIDSFLLSYNFCCCLSGNFYYAQGLTQMYYLFELCSIVIQIHSRSLYVPCIY